jgi:aminoglycoside phosphotransferase (APT) family kinase protein
METTLDDRLLACLRERLGGAVSYAEPPTPLSGGFDTIIHGLRLSGATGDWSGPLILRIMTRGTSGARVRREAAAHAALDKGGFPVPRVLLAEPEPAPLGAPFLIMLRLAGETMWSAAAKARSLAPLLALPRRLAEIHARLHRVGGELLRESAQTFGVDLATMRVEARVEDVGRRIDRAGLGGLSEGARWLVRNRPAPAQAEVISHGDFHPHNIMVEGGRLSGVIDWADVTLAEPAYDIAGLRVIALYADPGVPRWARRPTNMMRRLMVGRYMSLYRSAAPLDTRNLPYYEAIRILSALAFTGEDRPQVGNPWNAPHIKARLVREFERVSGVRVHMR